MLNVSFWVYILVSALCVSKVLSFHPRTLVVMEDNFSKQQYSRFFKSLKQRGHKLDFKTATDKNVQISQYGVLSYENVILLAPSASKIGESLSHKHFLDFLDSGGNLLVGLTNQGSLSIDTNFESIENRGLSSNSKPAISDLFYKLSEKCGVTIHPLETMVLNNMGHAGVRANAMLPQRNLYNNDIVVQTPSNQQILFNGIGMTIPSHAHLCHSLLTGDAFTYSVTKGKDSGGAPDKNIIASNTKLSLISSLQTRGNSRITFVGSMAMLTDEYFLATKQNTKSDHFDNQQFMDQITKYTFGERGIVRATNATHFKIGDITVNPNRYRIKDEIEFHIELEEFSSECDCWIPFTENDVQFEFVRLDPFVRRFMEHDGKGHYWVKFTIPDVQGVYKYVINYQRRGWSNVYYEEIVSVRPYFHNEYERFLGAATPYYCGAWSMIFGFMIFSLIFLFGAKGDKKVW